MTDGNQPFVFHAPDARRQLAAEFALGLCDQAVLPAAMQLYINDRDFAALVDAYELSFADLAGEPGLLDPALKPIWSRIESVLDGSDDRINGPTSTNDNHYVGGFLRTAASYVLVAAVSFAVAWFTARSTVPSTPVPVVSVAQITSNDTAIIAVAYDSSTGRMMARFLGSAPSGRVPQLWLIGADGKPRSLGFTAPGRQVERIVGPELQQLMIDGSTIAISLELSSPTPHDAPAGPILGTAKLSSI